jgi:hypothetical protein
MRENMQHTAYSNNVVTRAFTWAYQEIGFSEEQAAELLGTTLSALTRANAVGFDNASYEYRTQLAFIRMYYLLISITDGDAEVMKHWFHRYHPMLNTSPKLLCLDSDGIGKVTDYLRTVRQNEMTFRPKPINIGAGSTSKPATTIH